MKMKKIYWAILLVVLFTFTLSGTIMAGNRNQAGDTGSLSDDEISGLVFMREEEKLARDVYQVLFEKWGLTVFKNIAESEQRHMDAILYLLGKYDLTDPAIAPGVFENNELQILYDELVAKGQLSVIDALEVGVLIEETDIEDIVFLLEQTDNKDITQVYTNLLNGSYNHLDAFESNLQPLL